MYNSGSGVNMEFLYQNEKKYFGQIAGSMESLGLRELISLGAYDVKSGYRGVYFKADQYTLYRIVMTSRLFSRVLIPLNKFDCHSTKYLYSKTKEIPWDSFFSVKNSFRIFSTVSNSKIRHSKYASLVMKDAIADYFREKYGERPSVDTANPDVTFNLHIDKNFAVISIDASGESMHKRGYRIKSVNAPMQETLAAAILDLSGWDGTKKLYDPFCGSGTILCEAIMKYCNIPASYNRAKFGFKYLPDFNQEMYNKVLTEIHDVTRDLPEGLISGSDISKMAVEAAKENISDLEYDLEIFRMPFQKLGNFTDTVFVTNPPYGKRLGDESKVRVMLKEFGDFLKNNCKGCEAYIYLGDYKLVKSLGLKPTWKKPLVNGSLDGRLVKLELY